MRCLTCMREVNSMEQIRRCSKGSCPAKRHIEQEPGVFDDLELMLLGSAKLGSMFDNKLGALPPDAEVDRIVPGSI